MTQRIHFIAPQTDPQFEAVIRARLGMSLEELAQILLGLRNAVLADLDIVSHANPRWNSAVDTRLICFNIIWNALATSEIALTFLSDIQYHEWWNAKMIDPANLSQTDKISQILGLERFIKHGFAIGIFIAVESTVRIFLRAIDPTAAGGATTEFQSVYSALLSPTRLPLDIHDRERSLELLNFCRLVRNLIHNDGVFFSRYARDEITTYRGSSFTFINSQPVRFVTWELLTMIVDDIRWLFSLLVTQPPISTLPEVRDPFH